MSLKVSNIIRKLIFTGSLFWAVSAQAQQDSLFLSVEQLFESGIKSSLQLQSDSLKERMAHERKLYAKTGLLPDLEIGLKGGIIGQPVVFQNGLSNPTYPDTPDWSQNYTVDFNLNALGKIADLRFPGQGFGIDRNDHERVGRQHLAVILTATRCEHQRHERYAEEVEFFHIGIFIIVLSIH